MHILGIGRLRENDFMSLNYFNGLPIVTLTNLVMFYDRNVRHNGLNQINIVSTTLDS